MIEKGFITPLDYKCYKILPLVYDDSLSYYEVLCKISAKMNELIVANNNFYDTIQESVNNWINANYSKLFLDCMYDEASRTISLSTSLGGD